MEVPTSRGFFVPHGCPLITGARRWVLLTALLTGQTVINGCGSHKAVMNASLPPAVPAAQAVLLFNGNGTSADVGAVEAVLGNLGASYTTADSAKMNAMSGAELGGYKLIIVPGGNSIEIGQGLSGATAANLRSAVQQYGVHYLGICAGAFFGAYSAYNGVNLTGGVAFDFYADKFKGVQQEVIELSFPASASLQVYWEDGPQLSGWGEVAAKFPDGTPAIVEGQSGNGFVIFTGVHPEAPASWLEPLKLNIPIEAAHDLAGRIIKAALDGTPLPHY